MSPVEFKKTPCRPVELNGQGPHDYMLNTHLIKGLMRTKHATVNFQTLSERSSLFQV